MSGNTIALLVYCAIGVMVIMLAICFNLIRMTKALENKIFWLNEQNEQHHKTQEQIALYMDKLGITIEQMRGSIEVMSSSFSKDQHDIQRQQNRIEAGISRIQCTLAVHGNRLHDIVNWTGMNEEKDVPKPCEGDTDGDEDLLEDEDTHSCIEYWAGKAQLADIVDEENLKHETEHDQSMVSYRWIFPSCDERVPEEIRRPVVGQWYLVVGTLKGLTKEDGVTPLIFSDEGLFNGTDFITRKDQRFDHVYAYIKQPSSADVMQQVFEMAVGSKG